ncbi:hypothetical protein POM88_033785 [Heracleum sosnowskyi]|uniref:Late embryogenesis abundant protein LEA-2 subgroup domain-containing protein n=1 Tax=Heracleum sosnowskyi TaxID=360622 RepID=A0AAD8HJY9_9APIA|nr:hypothetical protein POM88_033785 [Heracleum sosnowskyi]
MPKPALGPQRRTNAIIWFAAIFCAIVAIAVVAIGLFVIISYLVIHPTTPTVSVSYANLDKFNYNQLGILDVQVRIVIKAKNGNVKNHAEFYGLVLALNFHGLPVAKLVNKPFNVKKNDSREFVYEVKADQIPLRSVYRDYVQSSLTKNEVSFEMKGKVKTRWRVWVVGSVKFSLNMDCDLQFFMPNGSFTYRSPCSSKSS